MRIETVRPSGRRIRQLMDHLRLAEGFGLREVDGIATLFSGAWLELRAVADSEIDGTVDNTDDINDALDHLASRGGGVLLHREGTAVASQILLRTKVALIGSGWGSRIKQKAQSHTQVDAGTSSGSNSSTSFRDTAKSLAANAYRDYSLEILDGAGAGQVRLITEHSAGGVFQLETPWATVPGAGAAYRILQPMHLLVLDNDVDEFVAVQNIMLDGNKSNQTAHNDGIHPVNTSGGPTFFDSHHLVQNVVTVDTKGNGITIGAQVREARFINVIARRAGRYGHKTFHEGGTDNWFIGCTFAHCDLTGLWANGTNNRYHGCKAFGNGMAEISGNGAGAIVTQPCTIVDLETQENRQRGVHFMDAYAVGASVRTDADGEVGILLDNAFDCQINGVIKSGAGLLYQTAWALKIINGSDRNDVHLNVRAGELSGGFIEPDSVWSPDNRIIVNNRTYSRDVNLAGDVGENSEHFTWGHRGSGGAGNPYWTFSTTDDAVPKSKLQSWDGTTARVYATLDHAAGTITLGSGNVAVVMGGNLLPDADDPDTGPTLGSGSARWRHAYAFAATITNHLNTGTIGTGGVVSVVTTNEAYRWGKTGSPASGNPYYVLKHDNGSPAVASLEGWNGATSRTFATFDYGNSRIDLGSSMVGTRILGYSSLAQYATWTGTGLGAPTFTTASVGVRLLLWPHDQSGSDAGHSIGVLDGGMWYGVGTTSHRHTWYAGTTELMRLSGGGDVIARLNAAESAFTSVEFYDSTNSRIVGAFAAKGSTGELRFNAVNSGAADRYIDFMIAGVSKLRIDKDGKTILSNTAGADTDALVIDTNSGTTGLTRLSRDGTRRWRFGTDGSAESGSNVGNDFAVFRYADNGTFLGTALRMKRSSGHVAISAPASAPDDAIIMSGGVSLWIDETNDELEFRVKKSNGSLFSKTL